MGDGEGAVAQQVAEEIEEGGPSQLLEDRYAAAHVCLTSTHGSPAASSSTTLVSGEDSADLRSRALPSGLPGRVFSASAISTSCAQLCFHLLGETSVQLPSHATLRQCVQLLCNCPFLLRKPAHWDIGLKLCRPVPVAVFLKEFKIGRYVLQVAKPARGMHCVAVAGRLLSDPADEIWLPLTEESFAQLSITKVISGLQVIPR